MHLLIYELNIKPCEAEIETMFFITFVYNINEIQKDLQNIKI